MAVNFDLLGTVNLVEVKFVWQTEARWSSGRPSASPGRTGFKSQIDEKIGDLFQSVDSFALDYCIYQFLNKIQGF